MKPKKDEFYPVWGEKHTSYRFYSEQARSTNPCIECRHLWNLKWLMLSSSVIALICLYSFIVGSYYLAISRSLRVTNSYMHALNERERERTVLTSCSDATWLAWHFSSYNKCSYLPSCSRFFLLKVHGVFIQLYKCVPVWIYYNYGWYMMSRRNIANLQRRSAWF